jgi:hypothetical protein
MFISRLVVDILTASGERWWVQNWCETMKEKQKRKGTK